jgi:hypothetical protein
LLATCITYAGGEHEEEDNNNTTMATQVAMMAYYDSHLRLQKMKTRDGYKREDLGWVQKGDLGGYKNGDLGGYKKRKI